MKQEISYNIHDLIKIKIIRNKKLDLFKDLNLKYSFFEADDVEDPDIVLNIGEFTPSNEDCFFVDHKYYVKNNYFYCKDAAGMIGWEVEIIGFEEGKTVVNFNSTINGLQKIVMRDLLPQNLILAPLLEYKLFQKNCLLLHAGAVSLDNKGFLFVGRGGSLKTTLIMNLVRNHNFSFLSDDTVLVCENKIYSFPTHLLEFEFRKNKLQNEHMNFVHRLQLLKYLLNKNNSKDVDFLVKNSVECSHVYFISKTTNSNIQYKKLNKEQMCTKIVLNNMIEKVQVPFMGTDIGHFLQYMFAYSYIYPYSKIATYWDEWEREVHSRYINTCDTCEIQLPFLVDISLLNSIRDFLLSHSNNDDSKAF